jgi:hypothetical protein
MRSSVDRGGRGGGAAGIGGRALLFRPEEGVGERDGLDVGRVRIVADLRVDEESDRQFRALARLQRLFGEAEALDLVEVLAG